MDPDFYFEETPLWKKLIVITIVLGIIGYCGWFFYKKYKNSYISLKEVIIELGDKVTNDIKDYAKGNIKGYKLSLPENLLDESGNAKEVGEYAFYIVNNNKKKKGKIIVKDTKPPVVETESVTVGVNEEFEPSEFITKCTDSSLPCTVSYKKDSSKKLNNNVGEYNLEIIISDKYGNETIKQVTLIVSENDSLKTKKEKDLEFVKINPTDDEWNETYTIKFDKALEEDSEDFYQQKLELTALDFSELFDKKITNQYIITIYNKYNYVIGLSVKLFFEDNSIKYLLKDEIKDLTHEDTNDEE